MKIKIKMTATTVIIWCISSYVYHFFQGPIESSIGVNQVDDNPISYATALNFSQGAILGWISLVFIIILAFIWIPGMAHHKKEEK